VWNNLWITKKNQRRVFCFFVCLGNLRARFSSGAFNSEANKTATKHQSRKGSCERGRRPPASKGREGPYWRFLAHLRSTFGSSPRWLLCWNNFFCFMSVVLAYRREARMMLTKGLCGFLFFVLQKEPVFLKAPGSKMNKIFCWIQKFEFFQPFELDSFLQISSFSFPNEVKGVFPFTALQLVNTSLEGSIASCCFTLLPPTGKKHSRCPCFMLPGEKGQKHRGGFPFQEKDGLSFVKNPTFVLLKKWFFFFSFNYRLKRRIISLCESLSSYLVAFSSAVFPLPDVKVLSALFSKRIRTISASFFFTATWSG